MWLNQALKLQSSSFCLTWSWVWLYFLTMSHPAFSTHNCHDTVSCYCILEIPTNIHLDLFLNWAFSLTVAYLLGYQPSVPLQPTYHFTNMTSWKRMHTYCFMLRPYCFYCLKISPNLAYLNLYNLYGICSPGRVCAHLRRHWHPRYILTSPSSICFPLCLKQLTPSSIHPVPEILNTPAVLPRPMFVVSFWV